ncbi:MAG: tyrosine-protein phosphatase [Geodermatophilaceae bacterium]|nr:tyrosine-protein phosphatase [Geodermatophilaceae bacterium]
MGSFPGGHPTTVLSLTVNSEIELSDGWVHLDGAVNVRDLGGLRTDDGRRTLGRRLLRADNLQNLTEADVRLLVDDYGVRQVLDLRTSAEINLEGPGPITQEEAVIVREFTLYPEAGKRTDALTEGITGGSDAAAQTPWTTGHRPPLDIDATERPAVIHYLGYLRHASDNIVHSLRAIGEHNEGATLVHCAAGKDRTGTVIALALSVAGVRREDVVADYARSGEVIDEIMARLASTQTYAADVSDAEGNPVTDVKMDPVTWAAIANRHRPRPETMWRLLEILDERAGGPLRWLSEAGLTEAEQDAIRTHLLG